MQFETPPNSGDLRRSSVRPVTFPTACTFPAAHSAAPRLLTDTERVKMAPLGGSRSVRKFMAGDWRVAERHGAAESLAVRL